MRGGAGMTLAAPCALLLLAAGPAAGGGEDRRAADLVDGLVRADEPGIALLVRRGGRTVLERSAGVRELGARARIGAHTDFRLASLSKAFTAAAVELLVRDGKLRYDEAITDVFPALPAYGRAITIRQLLTHTSGLPDYEELMAEAEKGRAPIWTAEHPIHDDDVLALLRGEQKTRFVPGTSWAYSNSGYVLLGLAVARVSGRPFAEFLHERIFARLRMDHTLAFEEGRSVVPARAFGHERTSDGFREADQSPTSSTLGDGGVYSNLEDLARWDEALRSSTLLSPGALRPALTPVRLADGSLPRWPAGAAGADGLEPGRPVAYGFGWFLDPWRGRERQWHHGETRGFRSVIERFPGDDLSIVILANRDDLDLRSLALRVADLYLEPGR
jgi:CubicO group peptidase (beta-lactamase class C family)